MKDCKDCPHFISDRANSRKKLGGATVGAPFCGLHGHVLGRQGGSPEEDTLIRQHFAADCEDFGTPVTASERSAKVSIRVAYPSAEAAIDNPCIPPEEDPVKGSCNNCAFYIPAERVLDSFGWALPLCAATGKLIANKRQDWKACGFAVEPGTPTPSGGAVERWLDNHAIEDIDLLEVYKVGFKLSESTVTETVTAHIDLSIDPQEYETDLPVSDSDAEVGIRAWRAIKDPQGTAVAHLPIFDFDSFSEEEQSKIPLKGAASHPELYLDHNGLFYTYAIEARELGETPLLQGNPGVGKTEFARALAYAMGLPFERIVFRQRMDSDALLGTPQYDPAKGTYFQPGRLPLMWEKRCVALLDEPNLVEDDDVLHTLRPLTDNSKELVIEGAGPGGSMRFQRNEHCYLMLAQNPSWDPRNIGTRELASADANRLSVLTMEDPPEAIVRKVVRERCALDDYEIPEDVLDTLMKVGEDIKALEVDGAFPDHWGMRQAIKVARKTRWYSIERAFRVAALDLYSPDVAELVMQSVLSHTE